MPASAAIPDSNHSSSHIDVNDPLLPPAPAEETGEVKAWEQAVVLSTYEPAEPDRNPMFLESRVYQGSSGRVYPMPVIDRIATKPTPRAWKAVHLENKYLRLMMLPEIGGRIHIGFDKTAGYNFFYRQNVIKPALVGLAGPWISGGVEFNWPQHHRPATFMPVEFEIERGLDGSVTVWLSDHDPLQRMKGMHGVCLYPDRAVVELKVRLYNRTAYVQTFLWWANVACRVHEKYQSFFPPDVRFVADHAKRAVTSFPLSDRAYYGVDYASRGKQGVPREEQPGENVPDGSYAANDLSWYANIPVPTSYMIAGTQGDFFGGYDHRAQAGFVHYADHHIAPGKKQWTWGNHDFGYAWDRNLTDADGPYIELMAGVYTDNQPDFSFLSPGETKTFSQYWYPIHRIGPPQAATLDAAISLQAGAPAIRIGVLPTRAIQGAKIRLATATHVLFAWTGTLDAGQCFVADCDLPGAVNPDELILSLQEQERLLVRYCAAEVKAAAAPEQAQEPPLPSEIRSSDELYLTGLHLEQYRHATRRPEVYWREALARDSGDSRCNNAMGLWHLRRCEFAAAEQCFRNAVARLTRLNPNPANGEPFYNLGLTLRFQGRNEEAYGAFYKAAWNAAWQGPAYFALAELAAARGEWNTALLHLEHSMQAGSANLNARNLKAMLLRQIGKVAEAQQCLEETRRLDCLDIWSRFLDSSTVPSDAQQALDLCFDLQRAGFRREALQVLAPHAKMPMALYVSAWIKRMCGEETAAAELYAEAARADGAYCFPSRLEEFTVLEAAMACAPDDASAPYYLGNLLYDKDRHAEAIASWNTAVRRNPENATAWRNLGIGYYNVKGDSGKAAEAFERALAIAPQDARILYERDQLWKRMGRTPEERLAAVERSGSLADTRDDLALERASLLNQTSQPAEALRLLSTRHFQPWEGGEGLVLTQYLRACQLLCREALARGEAAEASRYIEMAMQPPQTLSEAKHLLANWRDVYYWAGMAYATEGRASDARRMWERAATTRGDFQQMSVRSISDMTFWSARALEQLGQCEEAHAIYQKIDAYASELEASTPQIDYFATSLPTMLLFREDLAARNAIEAKFLHAQAAFGTGRLEQAQRLLTEVLAADRNHAGAADLLGQLRERTGTGGLS